MIRSFASRETELLFHSQSVARFSDIEKMARRKLVMLHAATRLTDLSSPPGNRLEALIGARKGQYSIRINNRWRLCFRWLDDGAHDVEIVDYHQERVMELKLDEIHPGEILNEEFLLPMKISVVQLADEMDVSVSQLDDIIAKRSGIASDMAVRLSRRFQTDQQFWLNLQAEYDRRTVIAPLT